MPALSSTEAKTVEACAGEPMLDQVQSWAAVNSGSRNLDGLAAMAAIYADAFAALPGELTLRDPRR
jgi:glutamate carboxypeptidase